MIDGRAYPGGQLANRLLGDEVGHEQLDLTARASAGDPRAGGLAAHRVPHDHQHPGPLERQCLGNRPPESRVGTGDQSRFAG
jgi:hypothetical protein